MTKPGPDKGVKLTEQHREKIRNSQVLDKLISHATANEVDGQEMKPTQVTAAIALLKKVLPDLKNVEHGGEISATIMRTTIYEEKP